MRTGMTIAEEDLRRVVTFNGSVESAESYLKQGAKGTYLDGSALRYAVLGRNAKMAALLLRYNPDLLNVTNQGETPIKFAVQQSAWEVVKTLAEFASTYKNPSSVLKSDLGFVLSTISDYTDANQESWSCYDDPSSSLTNKCTDIVTSLLKAGAPMTHGPEDYEIIHRAAYRGNDTVVSLLIQHDPAFLTKETHYFPSPTGLVFSEKTMMPIEMAARSKKWLTVEILMKELANGMRSKDATRFSSVVLIEVRNHAPLNIIQFLLKNGGTAPCYDGDNMLATHLAVKEKDLGLIKTLAPIINCEDPNGRTALVFAVLENAEDSIISCLLESGAGYADALEFFLQMKERTKEVSNKVKSKLLKKEYKDCLIRDIDKFLKLSRNYNDGDLTSAMNTAINNAFQDCPLSRAIALTNDQLVRLEQHFTRNIPSSQGRKKEFTAIQTAAKTDDYARIQYAVRIALGRGTPDNLPNALKEFAEILRTCQEKPIILKLAVYHINTTLREVCDKQPKLQLLLAQFYQALDCHDETLNAVNQLLENKDDLPVETLTEICRIRFNRINKMGLDKENRSGLKRLYKEYTELADLDYGPAHLELADLSIEYPLDKKSDYQKAIDHCKRALISKIAPCLKDPVEKLLEIINDGGSNEDTVQLAKMALTEGLYQYLVQSDFNRINQDTITAAIDTLIKSGYPEAGFLRALCYEKGWKWGFFSLFSSTSKQAITDIVDRVISETNRSYLPALWWMFKSTQDPDIKVSMATAIKSLTENGKNAEIYLGETSVSDAKKSVQTFLQSPNQNGENSTTSQKEDSRNNAAPLSSPKESPSHLYPSLVQLAVESQKQPSAPPAWNPEGLATTPSAPAWGSEELVTIDWSQNDLVVLAKLVQEQGILVKKTVNATTQTDAPATSNSFIH